MTLSGVFKRFVTWHLRTYGTWATRKEPYSFAIYPLLALIGPLIWWILIGPRPALVVLAIVEGLTILWGVYLFYVRRRRLR